MLPFDIAPFECACVWEGREGESSSREENKAIEFWSPTRNSWSVTINAKCCTWHTLRGHVILPTPQLLLLPVLLLDGSRETTTSPPGWGAQYEQKKEKEKKMPSCVERLLLTAAALTLYVNFRRGLIRVHRSKDVRQRAEFSPIYGRQAKTNINCRPGRCCCHCCCCFHSAQNAIF